MRFKQLLALLLMGIMLFSACGVWADAGDVPTIETDIYEIQKYGNLVLSLYGSTLLEWGYEYGDIITVAIGEKTCDMPIGSNYSDVDMGEMVCRVIYDASSGQNAVLLAINMGDLATTLQIAEKKTIEEEPGYQWVYAAGMSEPVTVAISMKEKGGYLAEYLLRQLSRSNERADYPQLSDAQYANFRNVDTTGMGKGALYRSSSPINAELNRNEQADLALYDAGVRAILNMADSEEQMHAYPDYAYTEYSKCRVIALNMGISFDQADFAERFASGLRFLAENDGPYLLHCTEGKDRTGFGAAVLECLMGAAPDEVIADYMATYENFYGVVQGTEQYEMIAQSNIVKSLKKAFDTDDLAAADLQACAEEYLKGIGLTETEIAQVKLRLATDYE